MGGPHRFRPLFCNREVDINKSGATTSPTQP